MVLASEYFDMFDIVLKVMTTATLMVSTVLIINAQSLSVHMAT